MQQFPNSRMAEEVSGILGAKYDEAKQLLLDNRALLDGVAEALLERETLEGPQLQALLKGEPLPDLSAEASNGRAEPATGTRDDDIPDGNAGGNIPDPEPMPS